MLSHSCIIQQQTSNLYLFLLRPRGYTFTKNPTPLATSNLCVQYIPKRHLQITYDKIHEHPFVTVYYSWTTREIENVCSECIHWSVASVGCLFKWCIKYWLDLQVFVSPLPWFACQSREILRMVAFYLCVNDMHAAMHFTSSELRM